MDTPSNSPAAGLIAYRVYLWARDPVLNRVMAELALLIAPLGYSLSTIHVWSEYNATCDARSREHFGADALPCLSRSTRSKELVREWRYLSRCT